MQTCKITMTTTIDEAENTIIRDGEIDVGEKLIRLSYDEENARVCIALQKGMAVIDRQGEYTLRLRLEEGKIHQGILGISGAEGEICVKTHRVKYSIERNVFKLSLRYDLLFAENEVQKTKLNMKAQMKNR